jgi:hypothetical protein
MAERKAVRIGTQKQKQAQVQIQTTERRRAGAEELSTWQERPVLAGASPRNADLGYDEEADSDQLIDDEEADSGESGEIDVSPTTEAEEETEVRRQLALGDLLGSRPPVVLLRLRQEGEELRVSCCAAPASREAREALELLQRFVARCFRDGRSHFTDAEWAELLGHEPGPLTRRLTLLLRLAIKASEKVAFSEGGAEGGEAFTPHDVGLERFVNKFAALPDGTPFSIRLLLLDQRGRERGEHFFDQLPDAVKLLALRQALRRERERGVAVSDNDFRDEIQHALTELLGADVQKPTEDQVRRRLRDNFKRKGLGDLFPNQTSRQREYDRIAAPVRREESA